MITTILIGSKLDLKIIFRFYRHKMPINVSIFLEVAPALYRANVTVKLTTKVIIAR